MNLQSSHLTNHVTLTRVVNFMDLAKRRSLMKAFITSFITPSDTCNRNIQGKKQFSP